VYAEGATAVLKGNLAPNGCVIKPAAADPRFLKHRGKAIAFEDYNHMMRDMIRISDGRMSGTSYGACILHVAPESYIGGPLALVQTGDEIEIDVDKRSIHLHVSDEE